MPGRKPESKPIPSSVIKKPYHPPHLTVLGTLEELTQFKLITCSGDPCSACIPLACGVPC